jgi:3-hydroxyisobutyrate dehydrogenase-like beta-hydroxyacid dehydrogenase
VGVDDAEARTAAPTIAVGLVGLGNMGMPIARRIAAAGFGLHAFARRPEVIAEARDLGASTADSLAALAQASDVVIVNVFDDDQLREVTLGDGLVAHMLPGAVLVNHATVRPATMDAIAAATRPRGIALLDCAMSGGPDDIAAGRLVLLVGGDADTLETVRPVFASYSTPIVHVAGVGDAQKVKLLNNVLFAAQVAFAVGIERCAIAFGMEPVPVMQAISACSGNSYALGVSTMAGSAVRLADAARRWMEKDVEQGASVAAELGVDLGSILTVAREM